MQVRSNHIRRHLRMEISNSYIQSLFNFTQCTSIDSCRDPSQGARIQDLIPALEEEPTHLIPYVVTNGAVRLTYETIANDLFALELFIPE